MRRPLTSVARTSGQLSLMALVAGITVVAAVQGCTGNIGLGPDSSGPGTGATTGTAGGDAGPQTPEEMFAALLPDLNAACGVACHSKNEKPFLKAPEYESVKAHPGLVIKNWQGSLFLSYSTGQTAHSGTQLDSGDLRTTLLPKVEEWLEAEAARLEDPQPGVKRVGPFTVNTKGFNAFYFNNLGEEDFEDIALTFTAGIDPTTMQLTFTNMQVNPSKTNGVHLVHPTFQVFKAGSDTPENDPSDTFAMFDASYQPNETGAFTEGAFALSNWTEGAQVGIIFEKFEVIKMGGGGTDCAAVDSFSTNAAPLLGASCATAACHGGAGTQAQLTMDLTALTADPAGTCAIVRNRVNLADPPMSQIFRNSDPNDMDAVHAFKFDDNVDAFNAFQAGVTLWITDEAAAPMP